MRTLRVTEPSSPRLRAPAGYRGLILRRGLGGMLIWAEAAPLSGVSDSGISGTGFRLVLGGSFLISATVSTVFVAGLSGFILAFGLGGFGVGSGSFFGRTTGSGSFSAIGIGSGFGSGGSGMGVGLGGAGSGSIFFGSGSGSGSGSGLGGGGGDG